jgi:GntR family transcriptional regulator / MocR family aminotransferase
MRTLYAERRTVLLRALDELSSPHLRVEQTKGGLHLVARLTGARDDAVSEHASTLGLAPGALSSYQVNPAKGRLDGLLLSFATLPSSRARDAVNRLARAIELARQPASKNAR